jgi:outer membrane protein assembly factor BamB
MRASLPALTTASAAVALSLFAARAAAVTTEAFVLDDAADFEGGELDGAAIESSGRVVPGLALERFELPGAATAYSLARAADGTLFVGTGNDGKVFTLRGGRVELYAETGQLLVASLAVGPGGVLYAGTLPEGRIYAIDGPGAVRELARPEGAEHVWALVWDDARQTLFAGTGPAGRVYAIDPSGRTSVFYDGGSGHVMTLALDTDGTLYAGTDDRALVLRLTAPGRATVVHDFEGNEITAIAARGGTLAVAANEFPPPPRPAAQGAQSRTSNRPQPGKGRLYRVGQDGRTELLLEESAGHFTAVQIAPDAAIFVAMGEDGRLLRVAEDHGHAVVADVDERQVLAMDLAGERPSAFVTGDGAAIYRVRDARPRGGAVWTSKALDARFPSRFGQITFRGDGDVTLETRSGNTERPDATWSEWSAPMRRAGPVRSPAARYLQVRAALGEGAEVRAITAFYLPQNQRAVVTAVRLKSGGPHEGGRPASPSASYELEWAVSNPDGDPLQYRLRFRNEAGGPFRELVGEGEGLSEERYRWDTSGVPDGYYVVEVVASDAGANPRELALESAGRSEPILVDNHAPRIEGLALRDGRLVARAIDDLGPIARLELAIDAGAFRDVLPNDHLLDTRDERLELEVPPGVAPGEHLFAIRATDAAGNSAVVETTARVGAARR